MALFWSPGAAYNTVADEGVNPIDVRKSLAGLVSGAGVLPGSSSPLVQGTASFEYQVNAGQWVTSRGASDGVHLWGNDGPVTVATGVAPGSGLSRIDIIYALHPSYNENGDTTSEPLIGVAQGTAASSPVAPSIPTGALELARNTMTSSATSTESGGNTITQSAARARLAGQPSVTAAATAPAASGATSDGTVAFTTVTVDGSTPIRIVFDWYNIVLTSATATFFLEVLVSGVMVRRRLLVGVGSLNLGGGSIEVVSTPAAGNQSVAIKLVRNSGTGTAQLAAGSQLIISEFR